jgi:hypothetical protein
MFLIAGGRTVVGRIVLQLRRLGVGSRQRTISAWQAEEQANYRLTLGQVRVQVVYRVFTADV